MEFFPGFSLKKLHTVKANYANITKGISSEKVSPSTGYVALTANVFPEPV